MHKVNFVSTIIWLKHVLKSIVVELLLLQEVPSRHGWICHQLEETP